MNPIAERYEPLYLKWRPQTLDELVGQTAVVRTLTNAIEHGRLAHAYLFTGPRGTGKTSSARILAKSLNCRKHEAATVIACKRPAPGAENEECAACHEIAIGISPAVLEIDAASNNSVDDARALIERAPLVAPGARYKVYIIDECHMLTKEAFNALLKTIEDPPPNVIFILATTEEHKVLPTIVSRCQRLTFRLVNHQDLQGHLKHVAEKENIEITERAIALIARRSGGGLRDALGLLDQASLLSAPGQPVDVEDLLSLLGSLQEDVLLKISQCLHDRQAGEVISAVNELLQHGKEPAIIANELARHFLNLAKAAFLGGPKRSPDLVQLDAVVSGSEQYLTMICQQAATWDSAELAQMVEALDRLEQTIKRASQPTFNLEAALLALCHRHDLKLLTVLEERLSRLEQGAPARSAPPSAAPARPVPPSAPVAPPPARPAPPPAPTAPAPARPAPPPAPTAPPPAPAASTSEDDEEEIEIEEEDETANAFNEAQTGPAPFEIARAESAAEPSPPPAPQEAAPAPAIMTAPAPAAASEKAVASVAIAPESAEDLDYVWSQTLDELQRRHIPTYSLTSMNAFPLAISGRELTVGVQTDNWQKMLETKSEHIKNACQAVLGREMIVKIKVAQAQIGQSKPRAREAAPQTQVPARESRPADADDEPDQAPPPYARAPEPRAQAAAPAPAAPVRNPVAESATAAGHSEVRVQKAALLPASMEGETIVKEAYKLFEGPGSRLIG